MNEEGYIKKKWNSWMKEVTTGMGEKGIQYGLDRQRRMEKENKTLGP